MLDLAAPSAAIGYGVGRIGCLLSGDGCYGIATNLPWGMSFPNGLEPTYERVHPTPLYEFLIGLVIAWWLWRQLAKGFTTGAIVGQYLVLSGIARFLIEFIPPQSACLLGIVQRATGKSRLGGCRCGTVAVVALQRKASPDSGLIQIIFI